MGEIAEAMTNGFYCTDCGDMIDGEEPGYPRKCAECQPKRKPSRRGRKNRFVEVTLEQFQGVLKSDKGWYITDEPAHEYIFGWRPRSHPDIEIKVATTVNKGTEQHRRYGSDAIRVWAIWCPENKDERHGLVKSVSIKRTDGWQGRLEKKVLDVLERARKNVEVVRR